MLPSPEDVRDDLRALDRRHGFDVDDAGAKMTASLNDVEIELNDFRKDADTGRVLARARIDAPRTETVMHVSEIRSSAHFVTADGPDGRIKVMVDGR